MTRQQLFDRLRSAIEITPDLAAADRVICMSHILREVCIEAGVPGERIDVLGNRVSIRRFHPEREDRYDPVIKGLFVGRLQPQKNIEGIGQALGLLKAEGRQVRLDVCGGRAVNEYLLHSLAMLAPEDWHYWGTVANKRLPDRYRAADMYLGPSHSEGFQIPLIEALACGTPCVASDQPPATEIIDSEVGELVDPDDPASIAAGIRRLKSRLDDADRRATIRAACRRRAVDRWSYEAVSRREVEIYLNALQAASPAGGSGQ